MACITDFRQNVEQFLFEQASNLDRKYSSKKVSVRLSYSLLDANSPRSLHIMIEHDDQRSHHHILSHLL